MDGRGPGEEVICLTVFVPLVNVSRANQLGSTEFWPGTHQGVVDLTSLLRECENSEGFTPDYHVGSALIFDYRLLHRGLPNEGDDKRPMLYMVWAKPWYQEQNFPPESLYED